MQVCTTVNLDEHFVLGSSQNSNFWKACFLKHCLFEMREVIVTKKEQDTKQNLKKTYFFKEKQNYKVWKSTNSRKSSDSCYYKRSKVVVFFFF